MRGMGYLFTYVIFSSSVNIVDVNTLVNRISRVEATARVASKLFVHCLFMKRTCIFWLHNL